MEGQVTLQQGSLSFARVRTLSRSAGRSSGMITGGSCWLPADATVSKGAGSCCNLSLRTSSKSSHPCSQA